MTYILIDDDELIHELWKLAARDSEHELACFVDVESFLSDASRFDSESSIYIDSNLKGAQGEREAIKVKEAGFSNIYIATGYEATSIDAPDFIKAIVGKRPPF